MVESNAGEVLNNCFEEDENIEIHYYESAFPSLTSDGCEGAVVGGGKCAGNDSPNTATTLLSSNARHQLSRNIGSDHKFFMSTMTTETFIIPFEERRPTDAVGNSNRNLQSICGVHNVRLEFSEQNDGSLRVFITGTKEKTMEAKKGIMRVLQTQHVIALPVLKEYHRHLIGNKGSILRELEKETNAQIIIPKPNDENDLITIKGTKDNVEHAKQSIQKIVDGVSKIGREIVEVDKRYHQLVCHKSNEVLHVVLNRKNLRLDIPPLSVNKNEISVSGDKEGVKQAASIIKQTYEKMRNTYQELQIEIPREKHRFIIGPRGSGLKEILDSCEVWVQINDYSSLKPGSSALMGGDVSPNTVSLLGPQEKLGQALTEVFTKTERVHLKTIPAPGWLHKFIIGKSGSNLTQWTADKPNMHLLFHRDTNEIALEGPPDEVDQVGSEISAKVLELESRLSRIEVEIDQAMIKHVFGANGSNIQRIRKETECYISLSNEIMTRSVLVVIGPPGKVDEAKAALLKTVEQIENTRRMDVVFPKNLISQLVGVRASGLKDIKEKYPEVRMTFPKVNDSDVIHVIGPKGDVDKVVTWLNKRKKELKESNYTKKVTIPGKYHRAIIGREGITIREIISTTNVQFDIPPPSAKSDEIVIKGKKADVESAEKKIMNIYNKEKDIIEVPIEINKNLHTILIGKGGNKINSLKEECGGQVTIRFPPPDSDSNTVIIKGRRDDVSLAQTKLHNMVEVVTNSNFKQQFESNPTELSIMLMNPKLRFVKLRETYRIRVTETEERDGLILVGQKENVISAIEFLNETRTEMGPIETVVLLLPVEHYEYFQKEQEFIRISKVHMCKIKPTKKQDRDYSAKEKSVDIVGPCKNVEAAKSEILTIIDDYENSVSDSFIIDGKQHYYLRQQCQSKLSEIMKKYNVNIHPFTSHVAPPVNYLNTSQEPNLNSLVNGVDESCSDDEASKSLSGKTSSTPTKLLNGYIGNQSHLQNGKINNNNEELIDKDINNKSATESVVTSSNLSKNESSTTSYSATIQTHLDAMAASKLPKVDVWMYGRKEKIEFAKEELIQLLIYDFEVEFPEEYYPVLIGTKGAKIRDLREKHDVNIMIPERNSPNKKVKISGPFSGALKAKEEIQDLYQDLNRRKEERENKNFRLVVDVPYWHHRALIGVKGSRINGYRKRHLVRIDVPPNENQSNDIIITGPKESAMKAKEDILSFIHKLEDTVIEEIHIKSSVHSRIIGSRGSNLEKLRKKYDCQIIFPARNTEGDEADVVNIKGTKDAVDKCADELVSIANQLLDEMDKSDAYDDERINFNVRQPTPTTIATLTSTPAATVAKPVTTTASNPGFQIRNAPWQLQSPSMNHNQNWADATDDDDFDNDDNGSDNMVNNNNNNNNYNDEPSTFTTTTSHNSNEGVSKANSGGSGGGGGSSKNMGSTRVTVNIGNSTRSEPKKWSKIVAAKSSSSSMLDQGQH